MAHFDVSPAAAHELLPACRVLFADARAERCRERVLAEADSSGLLVARGPDGRLRAATLVQRLPGAVGVIVPPRGDSADARDAVAAAGCAWLRARGVKVGQAFAAADEAAHALPLEGHGFRHVTQLVFLERAAGGPLDPPVPLLRCSSWPEETAPEHRELLLATHEGTADCPELNAPRTADEIVAGFQPNNAANRMWWTARDESGAAVGVLLVVGGEGDVLEISYLGLVPAARGRGLASALMRFADRVATAGGFRTLSVTVDARNAPAMALYSRAGFVECDRHEVWLASWPG
jgi:ribosomal protein S18 acetylase RimI-like enzyme